MTDQILKRWDAYFGPQQPEIIIRSPGRVNIIGEHTDYNQGWVLPGAINQSLYILISKSSHPTHHWIAHDLNEEVKTAGNSSLPDWAKYIDGAIAFYKPDIGPLHILISGDLPIGAGISSSSALVCGMLVALQEMTASSDSKVDLARLGSRIEREVIGVQGGIMDQYAIMMSRPGHLMLLDCRSKEFQYIKVELKGYQWMLINTKVKHNLIESDYNQRATECSEAVEIIRSKFPKTESLRDVTLNILNEVDLSETLLQRSRFVIEENDRVLRMVEALQKHDVLDAGRLLSASHEGLKTLYEVSCPELDHLVDFANHYKDVLGARMMGGGFGGCVICLIKEEAVVNFKNSCIESYTDRFGFSPEFILFELGAGAERICKA